MMADKKRIDFESYYRELYGERWEGLRSALLQPTRYATLEKPLLQPYYLDAASVQAAVALRVEPGDRVLDLCAAPGGKSLVLALALNGEGELIANELSMARRERLRRVVEGHLPEQLRGVVSITGHDAERWGLHEQNSYDRILLDAPCSSERHLLEQPALLKKWSPARSRQLSQRQHAMLCAGFDALKHGGRLVYSTCALSPRENDEVVAKLLKSRKGMVEVVRQPMEGADQTEWGSIALPDRTAGAGPIYCAVVTKL